MDSPVLIVAVVGASASLVGATIGGIVSYQAAKLQFNANVIQTYRKEWINQFREVITSLRLSAFDMASLGIWKKWTEQEFKKVYDEISLQILKLGLLARPKIDAELRSATLTFAEKSKEMALKEEKDKGKDFAEWTELLQKVTVLAAATLQAEYEKMEGQSVVKKSITEKWPVWLIIILLLSLNIWVWFK